MKIGLQHSEIIDLVAETEDGSEIILALIEERPWDGSADRLSQLQEKLNNYLKFALDGEMARLYPGSEGKKLRLRLYCSDGLDESVQEFLDRAMPIIAREGVLFEIRSLDDLKDSVSD